MNTAPRTAARRAPPIVATVHALMREIEADPARPAYLLTELGVGYRLRTPDQLDGAP